MLIKLQRPQYNCTVNAVHKHPVVYIQIVSAASSIFEGIKFCGIVKNYGFVDVVIHGKLSCYSE